MLLTDGEINLCGIKHVLTKEDAQFIVKAQLKKFMEWGNGPCPHLPGPYSMRKRACDKCWQALLEEVKGLNKKEEK